MVHRWTSSYCEFIECARGLTPIKVKLKEKWGFKADRTLLCSTQKTRETAFCRSNHQKMLLCHWKNLYQCWLIATESISSFTNDQLHLFNCLYSLLLFWSMFPTQAKKKKKIYCGDERTLTRWHVTSGSWWKTFHRWGRRGSFQIGDCYSS